LCACVHVRTRVCVILEKTFPKNHKAEERCFSRYSKI